VLCAQCVALLALIAVVILVSGVLDGNDSASDNEPEAELAQTFEAAEEDVSPATFESSSPIIDSSIAESNEGEPAAEETPEAESSAAPNAKGEPDDDKKTEPKRSKQAAKAPSSKEKPPNRKVENPLRQLSKSVNILESLATLDETVLGPLRMPSGLLLDIEMHGGATAHRVKIREEEESPDDDRRSGLGRSSKKKDGRVDYDGLPTFRLKETFDDAGNTFWVVDLTDYRGEVAKIWMADGQLRFKWTENSGRYEESGYLANCVLLLTIPTLGQAHTMALRKPIRTKAAPIDFVRGTVTTECTVPFMPPDVTLTVETIGATKPLPKPLLGMDRWITTDRDFTYLKFGNGAPLVVKVLASTKYADPQPRIVTASYFNLPRVAENVSGTLSQLASIRTRSERTIQQLNDKKAELAKVRSQNARQRSALSKARREIERELRSYQSQMRQIKWLEGITKNSQKPPGIVFRIIHSAGDHTVDLVHGGL